MTDQQVTWAVEAAIVKLLVALERLVLHALVGAINNDTALLAGPTGVKFPRHLTDEVCEFLVVGNGYFDFRGRDGLVQKLKEYLPSDHYLVEAVKKREYREPLNRLFALRNFAAHEGAKSKRAAVTATGTNMSAAGAWIKRRGRFKAISGPLVVLAAEIGTGAPY